MFACRRNMVALGFDCVKKNNKAMVSKIGWRPCTETKPLWVQVMKHKYKVTKIQECGKITGLLLLYGGA